MRRSLLTLSAGFLCGAAAAFAVFQLDLIPRHADQRSAPVIENVPTMSREAAESHRATRYSEIHSIEDTLALPGDFAQTEALYTLAGRSDSSGIQNLIFQANGIADPSDRKAALQILFSRLTELDVHSALALSRTRDFRADRNIEAGIWHDWGRLDLDAALAAAGALGSATDRNLAAQALFAAYDYHANDTTDYIEDILGIGPNSSTIAAYLFHVGDRNPAEAISIINEMSPSEQHRAASQLGHHLGRLDGTRASRHADLFREFFARQIYRQAVTSAAAETDPEAVLEAMLAGRPTPEQTMQVHAAFQALASRDIDKAWAYLDQTQNPQQRTMLASVVGGVLADNDPERALAWAKEYDRGRGDGVLGAVLSSVALTRPDLAFDEVNRLSNPRQRQMALSMIAMTVSQRDPQQAIALLDQVQRPGDRQDMAQNIAMVWLQSDADAAMSWIMERDASGREGMLQMAVNWVAQIDPDAAIRWLPRLDEETQQTWRAQIASSLADRGSVQEARNFIARFEGSEDYPQLLASAINGIAQTDIATAIEMTALVPAGLERDVLYSNLIGQSGHQDPQQAVALLSSIADDTQRAQATAMLAMVWSHSDPEGAQRWAQDLPRGDARDDAIMSLTSNWDELTPSRRLLLDSIGNLEKRKQAMINHIHRIAQSNARQAESMMHEMNLTDDERRQLQEAITMIQSYR
jgi:hypothetical protein